MGDERNRRAGALHRLQQSLAHEAQVVQEAAVATEAAATTAIWLGASLADLALVTGKTRQAARKRWPSLGEVYRRRLWLGNHVDEIRRAVHVVLENQAEIDVDSEVLDELRAREAEVAQQFDEAAVGDAADPAHRWHSLDRLVNVALRGLTNTARTTGEQGEFAIHGAAGVVGFYDHAIGDGRSS
ncbi:hypothetical protein KVY23_18655 [Rhodococcus sp. I2R]|nr:hypothetical protein [Rhodococcus sp. I2R]